MKTIVDKMLSPFGVTEEWLKYRSTRMGSSDAPVVMGVSPYKNVYDLFLEKTGQKQPSPVNKFVTDKGNTYEDLALLDLEDFTKLTWRPEVFVKEDNDKIISSVDGFNEEELLFWECKYVGKEKYNNFLNDLLPLRERVSEQYYPQVIHHALTTGGERFYFSVVVDHQVFPSIKRGDLVFKHIRFTLSEEDKIYMNSIYKPMLNKFLQNLAENKAPMGIGESVDFISVDDSELERLLSEYKDENQKLKPISDTIDKLKKTIFELSISYNQKVSINGNKISVSTGVPKTFVDYELLVKENPHIIEGIDIKNYTRTKDVRTTKRITIKKD